MLPNSEYCKATFDVSAGFLALRPPRRVSVAEGATDSLVIHQPGGYTGPWSADETPYMVEPMNMLASRKHEAVCFVGPARTGKTMALIDGWVAHAVTNDPGDFAIIQMTQDKAREYSKTRIDRMLRYSEKIKALKSLSSQHDNTHDKMFRHGMWLRIAWPTVSNLSSSDYRYVALTDYDRMPDDIDGEGSAYGLGLKRTTTFLSRGMCMVESSPGRDIEDPNWTPATPHEAPPVGGVLGIYNLSDRRRWYWPCPDCRKFFEVAPGLSLFGMPDDSVLLEIVRDTDLAAIAEKYQHVICPHCNSLIPSRMKQHLNRLGVWLAEGESITPDGVRYGNPVKSTVAGYWMGGCAAAYQSWKSLVMRHLQGLRDYALTGEEHALKVTTNTDQGVPYLPRALKEAAAKGIGIQRADDTLQKYHVPDEARFVVAMVDVQGDYFVVQVHAVGVDYQQWIIDRYDIRQSRRVDKHGEIAAVNPASYTEDWDLITERVVQSTYKTSMANRELQVLMTVVDSNGAEGVTDKAYFWFRKLRQLRLHDRVMLIKGASTRKAPMLKLSMVGGRTAKEPGDVPLYVINTNLLKDAVHAGLRRQVPGPGFIHVPGWVTKAFRDELYNSEVRGLSGAWAQIRPRNEAFDLAGYARAACLRLGIDKIKDWANPPAWAAPLAQNRELVTVEERREMKEGGYSIMVDGDAPTPRIQRPEAPPRRRRTSTSSYLG